MTQKTAYQDDHFHDECGVFGVFGHPEASNLAYLGLYALQHRGQESAGIVSSDGGELHAYRAMGEVEEIFAVSYTHLDVYKRQPFTHAARPGQILKIPIAHNDGNYTLDEAALNELERNRQILFRYTTTDGKDDAAGNPNGSLHNIAGVCNRERNVAGLMPHPERAVESVLDSADGLVIFNSMIEAFVGAAKASA